MNKYWKAAFRWTALSLGLLLIAGGSCEDPNNPAAEPTYNLEIISPDAGGCYLVGQSISAMGTMTVPSGSPTPELNWEFVGGTPSTATGSSASVSYDSPGSYIIRLKTDVPGREPELTAVVIQVYETCEPIVADIYLPSSETTIEIGSSLTFGAICNFGNAPHKEQSWTVSDGRSARGSGPTFPFDNPGCFTVFVECCDNASSCDTDSVKVNVTAPDSGIVPGLYALGISQLDGFAILAAAQAFAAYNEAIVTLIGHAAGASLYSMSGTPIALDQFAFERIVYGVVVMAAALASQEKEGDARAAARDAIFAYGPDGGLLTPWDPIENDWGGFSMSVQSFSTVTDALAYNNDPTSGGMLTTSAVQIVEVEFSTEFDGWTIGDSFSANDFRAGSGNMATAIARDADGSMLVATNSSPGSLMKHSRTPGVAATYIGNIGSGARQMRLAGNVVAISNFESDDLTIATWDSQTDSVTIVGQIAVEDGPIGIDLRTLPNGDVAILSTGFFNDRYNITVVDPQGALVQQISQPVDAGCGSPGHAAWADDAAGHLAITCNSTGNMQIIASGL